MAFLEMDKAYDRVNRKKLFEVMRCYDVHEKLIRLIERIYDGSMVKFELEKVTLDLLWLRNINNEGIAMLGIKYDKKCVEEDFGGENPEVWQETVEEWFRHK